MSKMFASEWLVSEMAKSSIAEKDEDKGESIIIDSLQFFEEQISISTVDAPKAVMTFPLISWVDENMTACYAIDRSKEPLQFSLNRTLQSGALVTKTGKVAVVIDQMFVKDAYHEFSMPIRIAF